METKITIVGANSFLSRNFVHYLINEQNFKLDNIYLYDIQDEYIDNAKKYKKIDLLDTNDISKINLDVSAVYFFSGVTGTVNGFEYYKDFIDINNIALVNFLEYCRNSKYDPLIVYPSSRLIYKENVKKAVKETDDIELKSVYAITKFAAEEYIKLYSKCFDIKYCILRICTPYGSLINSDGHYGTFKFFVDQASLEGVVTLFGKGDGKKTYTHVYDICSILSIAPEKKEMINEVLNIGGDTKSLLEIAEIIAADYNAAVKHIEWPDINKKVDGGTVVFDSTKLDKITDIHYKKIQSFKHKL